MEYFGLGSAAEMETPLGLLVKSATDPMLLGPDWAKNLEICDSISGPTEAAAVTKAIQHQLKNSDPKAVQLALTLADTCVQNSWTHVPRAINKSFMDELAQVCRGRRGVQNQDEALRLVQVWGRRFEKNRAELPLFFDTYMGMRSQGAAFPPEEAAPAPAASSSSTAKKTTSDRNDGVRGGVQEQEQDPTAKISADLNVVLQQVRLCREMLPQSSGIASDELLAEVVGFLEACRMRLLELAEAGAQGLLSEELFEQCLRVNDALSRTLEAEKDGVTIAVDEGTQPIGGEVKQASSSAGLTASLLDEELDEFSALTLKPSSKKAGGGKKIPAIKGPGGAKATGKSGSGLLLPPPSSSPSQQQPQQQQQQQLQHSVDLDFLGGMGGSSPAPPRPLPATGSNNPFDDDLSSLLPPPPSSLNQSQQAAARGDSSTNPLLAGAAAGPGSVEMTDEEFESFLNK